jgi:hypothetical protein
MCVVKTDSFFFFFYLIQRYSTLLFERRRSVTFFYNFWARPFFRVEIFECRRGFLAGKLVLCTSSSSRSRFVSASAVFVPMGAKFRSNPPVFDPAALASDAGTDGPCKQWNRLRPPSACPVAKPLRHTVQTCRPPPAVADDAVSSLWMNVTSDGTVPFPAGVSLRWLDMWPPSAWYNENALPLWAQGKLSRVPDCADADGCGVRVLDAPLRRFGAWRRAPWGTGTGSRLASSSPWLRLRNRT